MIREFQAGSGRHQPSVLIGHDAGTEDMWASRLRERLGPVGVEVRDASTSREVLRVIEMGLVHVALLADAPRLDGLAALRMIRSIDSTLPCVLITAGPDRRWLERALALRADSVFSPPIDLELMCRLVTRLLRSRGGS